MIDFAEVVMPNKLRISATKLGIWTGAEHFLCNHSRLEAERANKLRPQNLSKVIFVSSLPLAAASGVACGCAWMICTYYAHVHDPNRLLLVARDRSFPVTRYTRKSWRLVATGAEAPNVVSSVALRRDGFVDYRAVPDKG